MKALRTISSPSSKAGDEIIDTLLDMIWAGVEPLGAEMAKVEEVRPGMYRMTVKLPDVE